MKIRENINTLDAPVPIIYREVHFEVSNSGHREFFHISPALITSSANKRGGVKKSVITNNSAGNFNSRPVTSRPEGGVIHDAKSVNADNRYLLNNKSGAK
jgi:hypothetical protein